MKKAYSLFKTNNHYYIYDANIDKVSKLSPRLYQLILNESEFQNDQEYDNLCKKGFFQSSRLNLAKRPETDVIDDFYKRKLGNVIFQTTQNCNLRCAYCPYSQSNMNNRNHNTLNMPLNTAKKVLNFIHMHSVDRENISIGFYGGEPLLNFDLIKNIVNYANNIFLGKELIYSITTNLTVITNEMLRFFEDNKFEIMVSLDGAKESNDKNRKYYSKKRSVFDTVIQNLKEIHNNYPYINSKCVISMVMDPAECLDEYDDLIKEYPFMKSYRYNAVIQEDLFSDNKNIWSDRFKNQYYYKMFLCYISKIKKYKFENDLFLFENAPEILKENISNRYIFDNNTLIDNPFVLTSGMCTIGKHKLFVDVHGNFYPCEKVGETNKDFLIGNCIEGFDLKKCTDLINFTSLFSDRCLNCIAMRDCQMCIKDFAVSGVYNEKSEEICEHYQNTFMEQLRAKAILHEALFEGGENSEIQ